MVQYNTLRELQNTSSYQTLTHIHICTSIHSKPLVKVGCLSLCAACQKCQASHQLTTISPWSCKEHNIWLTLICQPPPVCAAQAMGAPWVGWVSTGGSKQIPHPGGITLTCLSWKPQQFPNLPARCGWEARETRKSRKSGSWEVGKSESWKLSGNTCSEGGNEAKYYSAFLATLIHAFYTLNRWSVG